MCLKCKYCKTSDLGVVAKEIKTSPVRMTDGKIVAALEEPKIESLYEVNFCFTCGKKITEKDLTDKEVCAVCGKEVDETVDGMCPDCKAKADEIAGMSKEELIVAFLKKEMEKKPSRSRSRAQASKPKEEEKTPEVKEIEVKEKEVAQTPTGPVHEEVSQSTQTAPANVTTNVTENVTETVTEKPKAEPAPVEEKQVEEAHQVIEEKVVNTPVPTTVEKVTTVSENFTPDVAVTQDMNVNTSVPVPNAEDDIMKALNGLENFNINDAPF